jgi:hypothetical protein
MNSRDLLLDIQNKIEDQKMILALPNSISTIEDYKYHVGVTVGLQAAYDSIRTSLSEREDNE